MKEDVIEVTCNRPQDAMDVVESVDGIRHAALFGRGLHVVVESGDGAVPAITAALSNRGFIDIRVEQIKPSLEDVFVSLIEARDRTDAPQQEFAR